ncbi:MAG: hypothetical protein ACI9MF_002069, partial [Gammaproteobacteria bacterium]
NQGNVKTLACGLCRQGATQSFTGTNNCTSRLWHFIILF